MFTTKKKIAEQVVRRLSGGDQSDDSEFDIREIILFVEQALAALVKANLLQGLALGETYIGTQYISTFPNVEVKFDEDLNLAYSDIPSAYLNLPDDRGVYHVSPKREQNNAFVPVRNGSDTLYSHSAAKNLEGRVGYYTEAKRIYYNENFPKQGCEKVLVKLVVPSPSDIGDDDDYSIGTDMELPVIEYVLGIMGAPVVTDDVNDSSNKV